ncbi:MAG: hypothetical protein SYC29_05170 [Planctomycetota bacterium]|nr:hypothetical protein [Planctomycetota bacterium]
MRDFFEEQVREIDPEGIMLIVVGAHLEAEMTDRALGYRLRERILDWPSANGRGERPVPVVCCDLWYLNNQPLRLRPAIAIGRPEINAASAFLAARLPSAFMIEQNYCIQLDPEYIQLNACLWGIDARNTVSAVDLFIERYLDAYLDHVHRRPGDEA